MADKKFIGKKARKDLYERDHMICCYCKKQCIAYSIENWANRSKDVVTLDHIVPQLEIKQTCTTDEEIKKALACPKNLVAVCNSCNSSKQETPLYIWCAAKGLEYGEVIAEIARRIALSA